MITIITIAPFNMFNSMSLRGVTKTDGNLYTFTEALAGGFHRITISFGELERHRLNCHLFPEEILKEVVKAIFFEVVYGIANPTLTYNTT